MKYLTFLFAIYLMSTMVLPCSDAFNECNTSETQLSFTTEHNHSTDSTDNCSPFCNCTCCHTTVDASFLFQPITLECPVLIQRTYPITLQGFVSNYYGNIWQPPKA